MKKRKSEKGKLRIKKKFFLIAIIIILVAVAAFLYISKQPRIAKQGDAVYVNYIASINKTIFDTNIETVAKSAGIYSSSKQYKPLEITVGAGQFIKGFEDALYGMKEGGEKTITIPPELAYGNFDPSKIVSIPKSSINNSDQLKVGAVLADKNKRLAKVVAVNETSIVVDFNSPLAGRAITFDITLIKIKNSAINGGV